jgi:hypothetical protein
MATVARQDRHRSSVVEGGVVCAVTRGQFFPRLELHFRNLVVIVGVRVRAGLHTSGGNAPGAGEQGGKGGGRGW